MKVTSIIKIGLYLIKLILDLGFIWLTLGWKVRKARRAFEKELIKGGVPREIAKELGKKYTSIKDEVMREIKSSIWKIRAHRSQ